MCGRGLFAVGPGCSASPIRRALSPYLALVLGVQHVRCLRLRFFLARLFRLRGEALEVSSDWCRPEVELVSLLLLPWSLW